MCPRAPAKGRGRIQVQIRRAYVAAGRDTLDTGEIYAWVFPLTQREYWRWRHRTTAWRELRRIADQVGRASTPGRPWLWRLKDPAAYFGESAEAISADSD